MNSKAARLGQAQLASVISAAADEAKARIEQLEPAALDSVSGGLVLDPSDEGDDWATDGAIGPDPDPFGTRDPLEL